MMDTLLKPKITNAITSDKQLFIKVITAPQQAFRYIKEQNYEKYKICLLVLVGISNYIQQAYLLHYGEKMAFSEIIGMSILAGPIQTLILISCTSLMIYFTGSWLGGVANIKEIFNNLIYASIPAVYILVLIIPQLLSFDEAFFASNLNVQEISFDKMLMYQLFLNMRFILSMIWLRAIVIGLAEIQQFSIIKSVISLIVSMFILMTSLLIILYILDFHLI